MASQKRFRFTRVDAPVRPTPETWVITLRALPGSVPPVVRVRRMLKAAGRSYNLRAVSVDGPEPSKPPVGQPDAPDLAARRAAWLDALDKTSPL